MARTLGAKNLTAEEKEKKAKMLLAEARHLKAKKEHEEDMAKRKAKAIAEKKIADASKK
jgi:hypothetical protein